MREELLWRLREGARRDVSEQRGAIVDVCCDPIILIDAKRLHPASLAASTVATPIAFSPQ
jgi:hypothetical protein